MESKEALSLIEQINAKQLLPELINQLNKDADLSGPDLRINPAVQIEALIKQVYNFLVRLMTNDFGAY